MQIIEAMEAACESDQAAFSQYIPDLTGVIEEMKALSPDEKDALRSRLERINMIVEGQALLLSAELEKLKEQITSTQASNSGTLAYRNVVAFVPAPKKSANGD